MKHIQKDYKVKMYIRWEFSANQNVVTVGERNDEDHAVPSVMKLVKKLTDEEVDEMILETDVDDTRRPQQLFDVPVPQIAEKSWMLSQHSTGANPRTSRCTDRQHVRTHTHTVVEKITKDSQSHAASCERTRCKGCLKTRSSRELVNKFRTSMTIKS